MKFTELRKLKVGQFVSFKRQWRKVTATSIILTAVQLEGFSEDTWIPIKKIHKIKEL